MIPARDSIFARSWLALTSAIVATIALTSFNILAVVAALPQITAELGDVALLAWVVTGFLLTVTLATVVAGPLIDAIGVRKTFRVTMVFFILGSVASAVAPSVLALVVSRGIQGIGAGLAFAVASATVGIAYPEALRPRALATLSVTWGVMALGGPTIAAVFVATTGWRGIFVASVPIALVAAAIGWSRLPEHSNDQSPRAPFDWRGLALVGSFTVVSLIGLSSVTLMSAVALAVAVVLGGAYWLYSKRAAAPVLERRHFVHHPIGSANLAFGFAFGAALGIDAYLPVYVTAGLGHSVVTAAFSVAFLTMGWTIAAVVMSRVLDRFTEMPAALVGFGLLIPAFVVGLAVYDAATPIGLVLGVSFVMGLGVGALAMSLLNLVYVVAEPGEVGRATAGHQYVRGLFQTYATAMVGTLILVVVSHRIGDVEIVRELLSGDVSSADTATRSAVAFGFRLGHSIALAFSAIGAIVALRLQQRLGQPLRRQVTPESHPTLPEL